MILGLLGTAGSGKSTVAAHLRDNHDAIIFAFAAPLKEIISRAFDLTYDQVYGTQAQKEAIDPRYNVSPRWLMQRIATEGVRAVLGEDFWTRITMETITSKGPSFAVIEDVRFADEVKAIHVAGGKIMRLFPPAFNADEDVDADESMRRMIDESHRSETEIRSLPYDYAVCPTKRSVELLCQLVDRELAR